MSGHADYRSCRRKNYVLAAYAEAAAHINKVLGSDRAYWMLIREGAPAHVIQRILEGRKGHVRSKDHSYAVRRAKVTDAQAAVAPERRVDHLSCQRVEVALVFQSMLSTNAAAEYLRNAGIPIWIAARVLGSAKRRPSRELVGEKPLVR
jgi:hypothetical protein